MGQKDRTGKNEPGGRYLALQRAAESYFPDGQQMGREAARWSAQDCMSHDRLPFIGRYSVLRPDWYVASGFQKWGMTSSMVSAMLIRDEICGIKNPYEKLFSPQRLHPAASAKDFAVDMWESMKGLARGFLLLFGKKEKARRCPHMGCGLRWNPDEESWDCPCHGSRFDCQGHLLDDPAQTSLRDGR